LSAAVNERALSRIFRRDCKGYALCIFTFGRMATFYQRLVKVLKGYALKGSPAKQGLRVSE